MYPLSILNYNSYKEIPEQIGVYLKTPLLEQIRKHRENIVPHMRVFSERLNHCLDETGAPNSVRERAAILNKLIDIPKQNAWGMLEGHQLPDSVLLKKIADEFEVDPEWLSGDK
jgi:hypothetical protein